MIALETKTLIYWYVSYMRNRGGEPIMTTEKALHYLGDVLEVTPPHRSLRRQTLRLQDDIIIGNLTKDGTEDKGVS